MAVEKVVSATVIGKIEDVDNFSKDIYLFNDIQLKDAMAEIDAGRFTLPVTEQNIDELLALANPQARSERELMKEYKECVSRLESFYHDSLEFKPELLKNKNLISSEILENSKHFLEALDNKAEELNFNLKMLEETDKSLVAYSYLEEIKIPLREINNLENFFVEVGSLTNENAARLKYIYENIPAVFFHLGNTKNDEQVFLVVSALDFEVETNRVLRALGFVPVEGYDQSYQGTPEEIVKMLEEKKVALERNIEVLTAVQNGNLRNSLSQANYLYNALMMLIKTNAIKSYMAFSEKNFYFAGWLPEGEKESFEKIIKENEGTIVVYTEPGKDASPPTKLRNNWLFRPFEQLVFMYGIPNYHELDPTPFLSITYIIFFGYMFGDVGQGIVLLLAGLIAEKKGIGLGGVIARVSIASIVFGFLYGSIFGNETLLPTLWLKPMENTTVLLAGAVIIGVIMLIIAYIYSLINKSHEHEVEAEYFGKNGYSGFILYIAILLYALMLSNFIPASQILEGVLIALIVILTIMIFLALPLTNIVKHYKFTHDVDGQYYVSSFFEVFEMYLSMLSNTLSFIRVGAFALTHVGMFMAFETIASLVGGGFGGLIVLIIGNIFIIVLEGLIDFIQCLRLEFYELFGKYYQGDGIAFIDVEEIVDGSNY